eukprot:scaffold144854_cov33-Prasinocladus_malaysianus.AAC.1
MHEVATGATKMQVISVTNKSVLEHSLMVANSRWLLLKECPLSQGTRCENRHELCAVVAVVASAETVGQIVLRA